MSTYRNQREVYETARDIADSIHRERQHADVQPFDIHEWYAERVYEEAERECTFTQDNWDVCNLFRCSAEFLYADAVPLSEFEDIDKYMANMAWHVWNQLIMEALDA
jgi:hypothetical protein